MAVAYRWTRMAGGFVFVSFMTCAGPLALADAPARPEAIPNGLLCTDQMQTQPDGDDLDPTEIADTVDSAACEGGTPVAI